jgi:hypothetical protein
VLKAAAHSLRGGILLRFRITCDRSTR